MRIDLPDHAGRRGDDEAAAAELPEPKAQGLTQVASESSAGGGLEQADTLNRLSKIVLAIVPALTVALAAVGSATVSAGTIARTIFESRLRVSACSRPPPAEDSDATCVK